MPGYGEGGYGKGPYGIGEISVPPPLPYPPFTIKIIKIDNLDSGAVINNTNPTISWILNEGIVQTAFRVQVSTNQQFTNVIQDSGKVVSTDTFWTIPEALVDNIQYFVRVKIWFS